MIRSNIPLVWFALFASSAAYGAASSVIASPSSAQVDVTRPTHVTVGWIVTGTAGGTTRSTQAVFRNEAGRILGTINQPLGATLNDKGNAAFVETVLVPENVVVRVHLAGETRFYFERAFNDGTTDVVRSMALHILAGAGSGLRHAVSPGGSTNSFDVSRLVLMFEPTSPIAAIRRGEKLAANVKITYSSTGILNAAWQVAGPNPGEQPEFRTLATVNQVTDKSGEVVFQGPALPAFAPGTYLVRFDVTTPALPFEVPEIRYIVSEK